MSSQEVQPSDKSVIHFDLKLDDNAPAKQVKLQVASSKQFKRKHPKQKAKKERQDTRNDANLKHSTETPVLEGEKDGADSKMHNTIDFAQGHLANSQAVSTELVSPQKPEQPSGSTVTYLQEGGERSSIQQSAQKESIPEMMDETQTEEAKNPSHQDQRGRNALNQKNTTGLASKMKSQTSGSSSATMPKSGRKLTQARLGYVVAPENEYSDASPGPKSASAVKQGLKVQFRYSQAPATGQSSHNSSQRAGSRSSMKQPSNKKLSPKSQLKLSAKRLTVLEGMESLRRIGMSGVIRKQTMALPDIRSSFGPFKLTKTQAKLKDLFEQYEIHLLILQGLFDDQEEMSLLAMNGSYLFNTTFQSSEKRKQNQLQMIVKEKMKKKYHLSNQQVFDIKNQTIEKMFKHLMKFRLLQFEIEETQTLAQIERRTCNSTIMNKYMTPGEKRATNRRKLNKANTILMQQYKKAAKIDKATGERMHTTQESKDDNQIADSNRTQQLSILEKYVLHNNPPLRRGRLQKFDKLDRQQTSGAGTGQNSVSSNTPRTNLMTQAKADEQRRDLIANQHRMFAEKQIERINKQQKLRIQFNLECLEKSAKIAEQQNRNLYGTLHKLKNNEDTFDKLLKEFSNESSVDVVSILSTSVKKATLPSMISARKTKKSKLPHISIKSSTGKSESSIGGRSSQSLETKSAGIQEESSDSSSSSSSDSSTLNSFLSDDSYYDETDEIDLACINTDQVKEKQLSKKMTSKYPYEAQKVSKPGKPPVFPPLKILTEANKLRQIFDVCNLLNNIQQIRGETELQPVIHFMKNLPAFKKKFDILSKQQIRQCLEKMEIKLYSRGTVLFRKGDKPKYSYLILLGVANIYHETQQLKQNAEKENISGENEIPTKKSSTHPSKQEATPSPRKNSVSALSKQQDMTPYRRHTKLGQSPRKESSMVRSSEVMRRQSIVAVLDKQGSFLTDLKNTGRQSSLGDSSKRQQQIMKEINSAEIKEEISEKDEGKTITEKDNQEDDERAKLSKALLEMENKPIDVMVKQLQLMQVQKIGSAQPGDTIGQISAAEVPRASTRGFAETTRAARPSESRERTERTRENTVICKSDCIILEIEQDIFEILIKQKMRRDREKLADQVIASFPKISKFYTLMRITDNATATFTQKRFKKGDLILKQGDKLLQRTPVPVANLFGGFQQPAQAANPHQQLHRQSTQVPLLPIAQALAGKTQQQLPGDAKPMDFRHAGLQPEGKEGRLMIISEGVVQILKTIEYLDENDKLQKHAEQIMDIQQGEIIGEDAIWFEDRACSYWARALTNEVRILQINNSDFLRNFGKVIPSMAKMFQTRHGFMEERTEKLRFQMEFNCLQFSKKTSKKQQSQWAIQNARIYHDPSSEGMQEKLKKRFLRESIISEKDEDAFVQHLKEYKKQRDEGKLRSPDAQVVTQPSMQKSVFDVLQTLGSTSVDKQSCSSGNVYENQFHSKSIISCLSQASKMKIARTNARSQLLMDKSRNSIDEPKPVFQKQASLMGSTSKRTNSVSFLGTSSVFDRQNSQQAKLMTMIKDKSFFNQRSMSKADETYNDELKKIENEILIAYQEPGDTVKSAGAESQPMSDRSRYKKSHIHIPDLHRRQQLLQKQNIRNPTIGLKGEWQTMSPERNTNQIIQAHEQSLGQYALQSQQMNLSNILLQLQTPEGAKGEKLFEENPKVVDTTTKKMPMAEVASQEFLAGGAGAISSQLDENNTSLTIHQIDRTSSIENAIQEASQSLPAISSKVLREAYDSGNQQKIEFKQLSGRAERRETGQLSSTESDIRGLKGNSKLFEVRGPSLEMRPEPLERSKSYFQDQRDDRNGTAELNSRPHESLEKSQSLEMSRAKKNTSIGETEFSMKKAEQELMDQDSFKIKISMKQYSLPFNAPFFREESFFQSQQSQPPQQNPYQISQESQGSFEVKNQQRISSQLRNYTLQQNMREQMHSSMISEAYQNRAERRHPKPKQVLSYTKLSNHRERKESTYSKQQRQQLEIEFERKQEKMKNVGVQRTIINKGMVNQKRKKKFEDVMKAKHDRLVGQIKELNSLFKKSLSPNKNYLSSLSPKKSGNHSKKQSHHFRASLDDLKNQVVGDSVRSPTERRMKNQSVGSSKSQSTAPKIKENKLRASAGDPINHSKRQTESELPQLTGDHKFSSFDKTKSLQNQLNSTETLREALPSNQSKVIKVNPYQGIIKKPQSKQPSKENSPRKSNQMSSSTNHFHTKSLEKSPEKESLKKLRSTEMNFKKTDSNFKKSGGFRDFKAKNISMMVNPLQQPSQGPQLSSDDQKSILQVSSKVVQATSFYKEHMLKQGKKVKDEPVKNWHNIANAEPLSSNRQRTEVDGSVNDNRKTVSSLLEGEMIKQDEKTGINEPGTLVVTMNTKGLKKPKRETLLPSEERDRSGMSTESRNRLVSNRQMAFAQARMNIQKDKLAHLRTQQEQSNNQSSLKRGPQQTSGSYIAITVGQKDTSDNQATFKNPTPEEKDHYFVKSVSLIKDKNLQAVTNPDEHSPIMLGSRHKLSHPALRSSIQEDEGSKPTIDGSRSQKQIVVPKMRSASLREELRPMHQSTALLGKKSILPSIPVADGKPSGRYAGGSVPFKNLDLISQPQLRTSNQILQPIASAGANSQHQQSMLVTSSLSNLNVNDNYSLILIPLNSQNQQNPQNQSVSLPPVDQSSIMKSLPQISEDEKTKLVQLLNLQNSSHKVETEGNADPNWTFDLRNQPQGYILAQSQQLLHEKSPQLFASSSVGGIERHGTLLLNETNPTNIDLIPGRSRVTYGPPIGQNQFAPLSDPHRGYDIQVRHQRGKSLAKSKSLLSKKQLSSQNLSPYINFGYSKNKKIVDNKNPQVQIIGTQMNPISSDSSGKRRKREGGVHSSQGHLAISSSELNSPLKHPALSQQRSSLLYFQNQEPNPLEAKYMSKLGGFNDITSGDVTGTFDSPMKLIDKLQNDSFATTLRPTSEAVGDDPPSRGQFRPAKAYKVAADLSGSKS